jgi:choline dehydrogenase
VSSNHVVADERDLADPVQYGFIGVWVNHVYSRGELAITAADPTAEPRIDEQMLSDQRDLARLRDGVRRLARLVEHAAFAAIREEAPPDADPEARVGVPALSAGQLEDDGALDEYLMRTAGDAAHVTSTCRMGSPDSVTTVVDPSGRVLGVDGLLVADASILPDCPRANTHLASVLVGEHLADLIDR